MNEDNGAKENSKASNGGFAFLRNLFKGKDTSNESFIRRSLSRLFGSDSTISSEPDNSQQKSKSDSTASTEPDNLQYKSKSNEPIIEEVDSDSEGVPEDMKGSNDTDVAWSNRNPIVELPEDQDKDDGRSQRNSRDVLYTTTNGGKVEKQSQSVSFKRVTCGGINGAYYTATTSRVTNNGVTLEETKQADRSTGQATHKVSRGIDGKGHSVYRRLNSDSKVDTSQFLHNLNEDELADFDKAWKNDADRHLQGWSDKLDFPGNSGDTGTAKRALSAWEGFKDPLREHRNRVQCFHNNLVPQSSPRKPKKVVTVDIE